MKSLHILRVFVNEDENFGNPLGIWIDENQKLDNSDRLKVARQLGNSETVFINNLKEADISIFNPQEEVNFAGYAVLGAGWFIKKYLNRSLPWVSCKAGRIIFSDKDNIFWIRAGISMLPPWNFEKLKTVAEVENFKEGQSKKHTVIWSWINKSKGIVRARTFAPDWGIAEDEANGSGAMKLATVLKRKIEVIHGKGSVINARPFGNNQAEVGGRIRLEN